MLYVFKKHQAGTTCKKFDLRKPDVTEPSISRSRMALDCVSFSRQEISMDFVSIHQSSSDEIESKLVDKDKDTKKAERMIRWGVCFCAVHDDASFEVETLLSEDDEDETCEEENGNQERATPLSCASLNTVAIDNHKASRSVEATKDPMPILISATDSTSSDEINDYDEDRVNDLPSHVDVTPTEVNKNEKFTLRNSLDFVADRFANFLCPGSTVTAVSGTTQNGAYPSLEQGSSKLQSNNSVELQQLRSVPSIATVASLQASKDSSIATRRPSTPFQPPTATGCADFHLVDDIMSPNGLELFTTIREWFGSQAASKSVIDDEHSYPKIFNRSSLAPRSHRGRRVTDLWSQWHAGKEDLASFHSTDIKTCQSLDQVCNQTLQRGQSPPSQRTQDLCYDSDPELVLRSISLQQGRKRRQPKYKRRRPGSIRTSVDLVSHPDDEAMRKGLCPPSSPQRHGTKASRRFFARERSPHSVADYHKASDFRIVNNPDAAMKELLKEIAIGKFCLVFHGVTQKNEEGATVRSGPPRGAPPLAVQAWVEFGRRLGNVIVQPKLVWCPTFQRHDDDGTGRHVCSKRFCSLPSSLQSMDLLTIIRVIQPTTLDRKVYPYARLGRSFQITSQDHSTFLFETAGRSECHRIMTGLKLMVARLASIVIVRDESMLHEFFSPWAHSPVLETMLREMQDDKEARKHQQNQQHASDKPVVVQHFLKLPSSTGYGGQVYNIG